MNYEETLLRKFDIISQDTDYILTLRENTKNKELLKKIEDYLDDNPKVIAEYIANMSTSISYGINIELLSEIVLLIIKDIINNTDSKYSDFEFIGQGVFSKVFRIGAKVLKIGSCRGTERFNNNPYILKPLLRRYIDVGRNLFFEITELVDTNINITPEDLYNLYKKLRELHLVWIDVSLDNVGRLLKDNKIYWKSNLNPSDSVLNLDQYIGNETLLKGDLVILDADYIFNENDRRLRKELLYNPLFNKFETRYKKETSKSLVLTIK